jgi:hypothetical protein
MNNSTSASEYLATVTPNDSTDLPFGQPRGIYVGVTGDVVVRDNGGNNVTLTAMLAGVVHPIAARRILSTGTTATGIVAIY